MKKVTSHNLGQVENPQLAATAADGPQDGRKCEKLRIFLRKFLQYCYLPWFFTATVVLFAAYTPVVLMAFCLPFGRRQSMIFQTGRWFSHGILRLVCLANYQLIDHRKTIRTAPRPPSSSNNLNLGRGTLFISNHLSLLDIPLTATTHQLAPLMKKEILYIPVINLAAIALEAIIVDRRNPYSRRQALQESMERIRRKKTLFYYPEGTRSKSGRPKDFEQIHHRIIAYAFQQQVPVTPISLFGTNEVMPPHSFPRPGKNMGMITHPVVYPEDFPDADTFARFCWQQVCTGFGQLATITKN